MNLVRSLPCTGRVLASAPAPHEIRHVQGFVAGEVRINGQPLALPSTIA